VSHTKPACDNRQPQFHFEKRAAIKLSSAVLKGNQHYGDWGNVEKSFLWLNPDGAAKNGRRISSNTGGTAVPGRHGNLRENTDLRDAITS